MHEAGNIRIETVKKLVAAFSANDVAKFGPLSEEQDYTATTRAGRAEIINDIKESMRVDGEEISNLGDIHPAWLVKALENESPKIIGIILRWLPSRHVRYILEHLPKKVKMSLPKLVESFAVPTPVIKLIKTNFEKKFAIDPSISAGEATGFEDIARLRAASLERFLRDLGLQELAMAFHNVESEALKLLLNRMSFQSARMLQQRINDLSDVAKPMLRDAMYTVLEVALDQEDIDRLLLEVGFASISKAMPDLSMLEQIQLKLEPPAAYLLKRYVDQYAGKGMLAKDRQQMAMSRVALLASAGEIE